MECVADGVVVQCACQGLFQVCGGFSLAEIVLVYLVVKTGGVAAGDVSVESLVEGMGVV